MFRSPLVGGRLGRVRGAVRGPAPRLRPRAVRLGAAEEERELRAVPQLAQAPHQPRTLRRPAQVNTVLYLTGKKEKYFYQRKIFKSNG